jgi:integrase
VVPLSTQALRLFEDLQRLACGSRFVLPHLSNPDKHMGRTTLNRAIEAIGYKGRLVPHGLRATASTALHELGYRPDVIERQLAHVERNEVKASYNHAQFLAERRAMMQAWSDLLMQSITAPTWCR